MRIRKEVLVIISGGRLLFRTALKTESAIVRTTVEYLWNGFLVSAFSKWCALQKNNEAENEIAQRLIRREK